MYICIFSSRYVRIYVHKHMYVLYNNSKSIVKAVMVKKKKKKQEASSSLASLATSSFHEFKFNFLVPFSSSSKFEAKNASSLRGLPIHHLLFSAPGKHITRTYLHNIRICTRTIHTHICIYTLFFFILFSLLSLSLLFYPLTKYKRLYICTIYLHI